jgi:hypothetical protein
VSELSVLLRNLFILNRLSRTESSPGGDQSSDKSSLSVIVKGIREKKVLSPLFLRAKEETQSL